MGSKENNDQSDYCRIRYSQKLVAMNE